MSQRVKRQTAKPPPRISSYWERTQWPLQSLYFLLPLLILYELGTWAFAPEGNERLPPIYAETMLNWMFRWVGWYGYYLPGLVTVVALLGIHLVRRDPWRAEPRLYVAMAIESVVLALPLFVLSIMLSRGPTSAASVDGVLARPQGPATGLDAVGSWQAGTVFSIGAGIYEELVFRLLGIVLLHALFADLLRFRHPIAATLAIAGSALAFALYHPFDTYNPMDWTSRDFGHFAFYTVAGLYFAAIYMYRGFGIVAATHAVYDVLVISLYFSRR